MRLLALITVALLPASAAAQSASPAAALREALPVCKAMFDARHPIGPGSVPSSVDPAKAGAIRARLSGVILPSESDLRSAGWIVSVDKRLMASRNPDWGRVTLAPNGVSCTISLAPNDDRLAGGSDLVAAAEAWIAQTYPSAEPEPHEILEHKSGKATRTERATWSTADGMLISMNVGYWGPDTRPTSFYFAVRYAPPRTVLARP